MTSSSKTSPNPSSLPWFETISSRLTPSHHLCKHSDEYVLEVIPLLFSKSTDCPHHSPPNYYCFFLGQLEGGFRLSIPAVYLHILSFYHIPLNQLALNAFLILAEVVMIFKHLQLSLSPTLFHCLFQLKMVELGFFILLVSHLSVPNGHALFP